MDASTETIIRKVQANFKVRRDECRPCRHRRNRPLRRRIPHISLPLTHASQEATSELARQIISEEVVRFLKAGNGAEVRRGSGGGW